MDIDRIINGIRRRHWLLKRNAIGLLSRSRAALKSSCVSAWYDDVDNSGDQVTPLLLRGMGACCIHDPSPFAHLIGVGSILGRVPTSYSGTVLGSGFLEDGAPHPLPNANILGVRGELSRDRLALGREHSVVLGDPGLIAAEFVERHTQPHHDQYRIGIIPHYVDSTDRRLFILKARYRDEVRIINIRAKPDAVIREIASCSNILSSSLHGLVFSDSLSIPSRWLHLSERVLGNGYKFLDYYSAFGIDRSPATLSGSETPEELAELTQLIPPRELLAVKNLLRLMMRRYVESTVV